MTEAILMKEVHRKSILIPSFKKLVVVEFDKILYIKAMQNYCQVYMINDERLLTSISFGKLLKRLKAFGFIQCHKSYAINKKYAVKYHKSRELELENEAIVPVSRRRRKEFIDELRKTLI